MPQDTATVDGTVITVNGNNYVVNDISKSRRDICLDLMKNQGYITKSEHDEAYGKDLSSFINPTIAESDDNASYFTDFVISQVISDLQDEYNMSYKRAQDLVYAGGLKIHTTMDKTAQDVIEKEFEDNSNFPGLTNLQKDGNNNIVSDSGSIILYDYAKMITDGKFVFQDGEYKQKSDGSLVVYKNKRLNIYKTSTSSGTDYSLEFKSSYVTEDGTIYIYPGGYINIPAQYKSLDKNGNLVISAEYINKNSDMFTEVDGHPAFTEKAYTMQAKVVQPQAAMVITEVGTGELKAMVGGRGVTGSNLYNRATNTRQPGSSIKPIGVYSTALQMSKEAESQGKTFDFKDPGNDTQGADGYGDYLTASSIIKLSLIHI